MFQANRKNIGSNLQCGWICDTIELIPCVGNGLRDGVVRMRGLAGVEIRKQADDLREEKDHEW